MQMQKTKELNIAEANESKGTKKIDQRYQLLFFEERSSEYFENFLIECGKILESKIDEKLIFKAFQLPCRTLPNTKQIESHFNQEFKTYYFRLKKKNHSHYYPFFEYRNTANPQRIKWHNSDQNLLFWVVYRYSQLHQKLQLNEKGVHILISEDDWGRIGQILQVRQDILKQKWLGLIKSEVKEEPWTTMEDNILTELMQLEQQISQTGQVEMDELSKPEIAQETVQVIELSQQYQKQWCKITQFIKGRTELQIRNRYNCVVQKIFRNSFQQNVKFSSLIEETIVNDFLQNPTQFLKAEQKNKKAPTPKSVEPSTQEAESNKDDKSPQNFDQSTTTFSSDLDEKLSPYGMQESIETVQMMCVKELALAPSDKLNQSEKADEEFADNENVFPSDSLHQKRSDYIQSNHSEILEVSQEESISNMEEESVAPLEADESASQKVSEPISFQTPCNDLSRSKSNIYLNFFEKKCSEDDSCSSLFDVSSYQEQMPQFSQEFIEKLEQFIVSLE